VNKVGASRGTPGVVFSPAQKFVSVCLQQWNAYRGNTEVRIRYQAGAPMPVAA
jgi:hypothetical protein